MCSVIALVEANHRNPLVNNSRVLPCAQMTEVVDPAWKHEVIERSASVFKSALQSGAGFCHDFKPDGSAGLLLDDGCAIPDVATTYDIPDLKLHEVTSPELAV